MSEKKNLSRAEQVRRRREQNSSTRVERARKESTRTPPVSSRRQEIIQPRRRVDQTGPSRSMRSARRRFQNALLPVAPDAEMRGISIARPNLGRRLPSFILVALLASAIYFAFSTPQLRVVEAQVSGNQMLTSEEINSALKVTGQPTFLLMPSVQ